MDFETWWTTFRNDENAWNEREFFARAAWDTARTEVVLSDDLVTVRIPKKLYGKLIEVVNFCIVRDLPEVVCLRLILGFMPNKEDL